VPGSLPVLFFGDLPSAEIATVGLNPSDQEYLTKGGAPLVGPAQRFATLESLDARDRASLTEEQCAEAVEWMRAYYEPGKPVYGWFNALTRVVEGFGASFRKRSAAHLDLIQESTSPVWSELAPDEREALLEQDLPFLEWEIRAFPLTAVICTGKTVSVHVRRQLGVVVDEEGTLARIRWWVGHADVNGRSVSFAGWNYPLARATGLGREGETALGELFAEKLERTKPGRPPSLSGAATRTSPPTESASAVAAVSKATVAPTASSMPRASRLEGLTHPVWDGVSLPKLRYWLGWWQDERKSAGRVENGWGREEQIERIGDEIAAREAGTGKRTSDDVVETMPDEAPVSDAPPSQPIVVGELTRGELTRDDLLALVDQRAEAVRAYLEWARENDNEQWSFRMRERPDIPDAAEAVALFPQRWWGLVVFTCFGSTLGALTAAPYFQHPLPPREAESTLERIDFPRGSIGHHRIQPAHKGAKQALVAACADHELFYDVVHSDEDFDTRYRRLRAARMQQWGRTTSFDLLLRAGVLGIGGKHYQPDYAYLGGSTGPKAGFTRVWGVTLNDDAAVEWAEALLRTWTREWQTVAVRVGAEWEKPPLEPCDQENFLCIYQERR
jgi:uracil-DNA glycosylase